MLRYFPIHNEITLNQSETGWMITAKRKPRGFVFKYKAYEMVTKVYSHFEAERNVVRVEGFQPVGFNGFRGYVYDTRQEAAQALCCDSKFWDKHPKDIQPYKRINHVPSILPQVGQVDAAPASPCVLPTHWLFRLCKGTAKDLLALWKDPK